MNKKIKTQQKNRIVKLSPQQAYEIVWMIGNALESFAKHHCGSTSEISAINEDPQWAKMHQAWIDHELQLLVSVLPAYHPRQSSIKFWKATGYHRLLRQLSLIKKDYTFPSEVEKLYALLEQCDAKYYRQSHPCSICGEKGADIEDDGKIVHESCKYHYRYPGLETIPVTVTCPVYKSGVARIADGMWKNEEFSFAFPAYQCELSENIYKSDQRDKGAHEFLEEGESTV